jgi:hypothetical protein
MRQVTALVTLLAALVAARNGAHAQNRSVPLTAEQNAQLSVNITQPLPGVYVLRAIHATWCAIVPPNATFFRQGPCFDTPVPWRQVALIPTSDYQYTLRSVASSNRDNDRLIACATVARNVVFGPARIDSLPCDLPVGATGWGDAGVADQRFRFRRIATTVEYGTYEILTRNSECWDVRDQSRDRDAEIVQWQCNGQGNQRFELSHSGAIPHGEDRLLRARGWWPTPEGSLRRIAAVEGVNLPGNDYRSMPTENDGGTQCGITCLGEAPCRAYTWVRPGLQGQQAMCWLKTSAPPAIRDSATASAIIR